MIITSAGLLSPVCTTPAVKKQVNQSVLSVMQLGGHALADVAERRHGVCGQRPAQGRRCQKKPPMHGMEPFHAQLLQGRSLRTLDPFPGVLAGRRMCTCRLEKAAGSVGSEPNIRSTSAGGVLCRADFAETKTGLLAGTECRLEASPFGHWNGKPEDLDIAPNLCAPVVLLCYKFCFPYSRAGKPGPADGVSPVPWE